jgi:membrane protease YdiL (CAAX protease family)
VKRDHLALAFGMIFPGLMAWLYFVILAVEGRRENPALMLAFGIGKLVQFTFPLIYVWCFERERLRPALPTRRGLRLALVFGLGTAAAILGLYFGWLKHSALLSDTPAKVYAKVREFGMATPGRFVTLAIFISLVHSALEEYYWRWFVFGWLRKYLALGPSLVLASLAFMAHHVIVLGVYFPEQFWLLALPFSLAVALGGGIWAWIYERSRSLIGPWLSHVLIDAAIMAVGYDMLMQFWS